MIVLEKPYEKERIPGLRKQVDRAVERNASSNVIHAYQSMTNEEVYALCPFSTFLDSFPGPSDWTALSDFQRNLDVKMRKELKTWAVNVIDHLEQRLYPKKSIMG